jgi:predicted CopG family antitoxin
MKMVKTTITLREDVHDVLKRKYGARGISKAINRILAEALLKRESMFGTMKKTSLKDLRDHRERT